jgi:uncharacterized protein with FMN-binding domain
MKKRFFLITTGTIGGLGAVLAVTPPQFGGAGGLAATDQGSAPAPKKSTTPTSAATPQPTPTKSSSPKPSQSAPATNNQSTPTPDPTPTPTPTKSSSPKPSQSAPATNNQSTPTPDPTPTPTPKPQSAAVKTVTGDPFQADEGRRSWGTVRVKVTFTDGVISSITGMQSPTSRGQMAFDRLDPYVEAQKITIATVKSKSANALPYVSGASYTCIAYWDSLKTAIQKAGL